jgi:polar amino acid transport system ATP-binding protein
VEDAVLYGVRLRGKEADVSHLLGLAGLDPALSGRNPQSLSVGQQQRVCIARALALEPEVLLMDEPTSALDQAARQRIEDLIGDLNEELGLTTVIVSHALDQVERIADRVVLLLEGRSEGEWSTEDFFGGSVEEKVRRFVEGEL